MNLVAVERVPQVQLPTDLHAGEAEHARRVLQAELGTCIAPEAIPECAQPARYGLRGLSACATTTDPTGKVHRAS